MTPLQCAQLCQQLYDHPEPAQWDRLWTGADVVVALKKLLDFDVVVFRGSVTIEDWMADLRAAIPSWDHEVGMVPEGFAEGIDEALAEIMPMMDRPAIFTGHSLGAARANIAGGKFIVRGGKLARKSTFGSPNSGGPALARLYAKYKEQNPEFIYDTLINGNDASDDDPVTHVPFPLGPIAWRVPEDKPNRCFIHSHQTDDPWGPLRLHHVQLYVEGAPNV